MANDAGRAYPGTARSRTRQCAGRQLGRCGRPRHTPGRSNESPATAVRALETTVPTRVALGRNYPNPFNSVTRIPYALPMVGRVEVTVFDMLGREVVRLADEVKGAG